MDRITDAMVNEFYGDGSEVFYDQDADQTAWESIQYEAWLNSQDDNRDFQEEAYWRAFCAECDGPCEDNHNEE